MQATRQSARQATRPQSYPVVFSAEPNTVIRVKATVQKTRQFGTLLLVVEDTDLMKADETYIVTGEKAFGKSNALIVEYFDEYHIVSSSERNGEFLRTQDAELFDMRQEDKRWNR